MNIYESINKIMAECPAIAKAQKNSQQGFMYRGVDVVMNVFQPLLAKYKVFVAPEVLDTIREERQTKSGGNLIYTILKVKYTFYAEDGSFVTATVQGEGMDSADKSGNKAMSVAFKYAMFQVFCIPTEEMRDPDEESPEESTPAPKQTKPKQPSKITPKPQAPAPQAKEYDILQETAADAELRLKWLDKYGVEKMDRACLGKFGTDFTHTPIDLIKSEMPE